MPAARDQGTEVEPREAAEAHPEIRVRFVLQTEAAFAVYVDSATLRGGRQDIVHRQVGLGLDGT
jgi:hypothetical protein